MCCTKTTIYRTTSLILGCSYLVDHSTNVSPKRIFDSPEEERLRKKLEDTNKAHKKVIKILQQKVRRKESRIISLKAILHSLKNKNLIAAEELKILRDIDSISTPSYEGTDSNISRPMPHVEVGIKCIWGFENFH